MSADPADAGDEGTDNFPDRALAEYLDAELDARRGQVLLLRLGGMTYAQIADSLKISVATARKDYDIALAGHATDSPEKMIARQRAILTQISQANLRGAMTGDKDAAAIILRALDQEAKLFGLNAPTRVLASVNPVDYANEAARLMDAIAQYDPHALNNLLRPKELTRDRTQAGNAAVIDADLADEAADPDQAADSEAVAADPEPAGRGDAPAAGRHDTDVAGVGQRDDDVVDESDARGSAGGSISPPVHPHADPDDEDDDWADVD